MAIAPNGRLVVERLAREFPQEFKDCHRPDLGQRAWAFIKRVAWTLHTTVDVRFGLNGKRGNVTDPSMDAVSFRNPASPAGGVEVIDVVAGAGSSGASPVWQDVTRATVEAGTVGAFIQPEPVEGTVPPPVTPPTQWQPTEPTPCRCPLTQEEADALFASVAAIAARMETLVAAVIGHVDDVKVRIERVSQEVANKATERCRLRW
jgi:hypothetical protein